MAIKSKKYLKDRFIYVPGRSSMWKSETGLHLKVLVNNMVLPNIVKIGIWTLRVRIVLMMVPWTWITLSQALQSGSCLTYILSLHAGISSELLTKMKTQTIFTGVTRFFCESERKSQIPRSDKYLESDSWTSVFFSYFKSFVLKGDSNSKNQKVFHG